MSLPLERAKSSWAAVVLRARFGSFGETSGKPEARQDGVVEPRDGADTIAGERDHEEAEGVRHLRDRIAKVDAEGRLTVGTSGNEAVAAALSEGDGGEEPAGQVSSLVFQWDRRHPHPRVVGHQGNDGVDVAAFEGSNQSVQEILLDGRVRRRWWLIGHGDVPGEGGAGSLQGAVHRLLGRVEDLGR